MMNESHIAVEAIRKKLTGHKLSYDEIFAIMDQISHKKLGRVLTTYFAASGYSKGFSNDEIYYLTKAMVETGEQIKFHGIVADKHSIGGVPGTRTSLIVVPIVASAGFKIPKSSSRAITTPGGTADDMEVLAPVCFSKDQIVKIVEKTGACIVWGGSVDIAPADDELIKIEEPLLFESYDKILVSIMAKKLAFGSNHIIIELPYGRDVKLHSAEDAEILKRKFEYLAERFGVKLFAHIHKTDQPAGRGVGPLLEVRESLKVLERQEDCAIDLEKRALHLAGILLDICLDDAGSMLRNRVMREFGSGLKWAQYLLDSGHALRKMKQIIHAQGGNPDITSRQLKPGRHYVNISAQATGEIKRIHSKNLTIISKILGAPHHKKSGIYLHKKIADRFDKGEILFTMYSEKEYNLREARESLVNFPFLFYE